MEKLKKLILKRRKQKQIINNIENAVKFHKTCKAVGFAKIMVDYADACCCKCKIETAKNAPLVDVSNTLPTDEEEIKLLTTFLDHYIIHRSTYMDWKTEDVATQWLDVRKKLLIMMRRGN